MPNLITPTIVSPAVILRRKKDAKDSTSAPARCCAWAKLPKLLTATSNTSIAYPNGERIETAHLNAIDTLREAGRLQDATAWIAQTRQRFAGTSTDTNALFGQLRLEIAESNWRRAIATADELSNENVFAQRRD